MILVLLTLSITFKSWRETKRSPYFFLRRQAAQRMQRYLALSASSMLLLIATGAYAWQAPQDTTPHVAVLKHAKLARSVEVAEESSDLATSVEPTSIRIDTSSNSDGTLSESSGLVDPLLQTDLLPDKYNQLEPVTELNDDTTIGKISFSSEITDDYDAVDPTRRFTKGFFTLYATFDYAAMQDGMVWSWVWRRNGQVLEGGNQLWSYGSDGPGYIYFRPEEGFALGEHTLEVWVNGEEFAQASFVIIDGVAASN